MKPVYIDIEELSKCKLNDFEAFDHCLFTDEERENPNKWEKFFDPGLCFDFTVGIPFERPQSIVEFQICHYILWNCIACNNKTVTKPHHFINCITGEIIQNPENICFACEYDSEFVKNQYAPDCAHCPIWGNQHFGCGDYNNTIYGVYARWSKLYLNYDITASSSKIMKLEAKKEAIILATIPWVEIS